MLVVNKFKLFNDDAFLFSFFFVVILKVLSFLYWGPGVAPDSGGYIRYSDQIINGAEWIYDAELESKVMPETVFRMIGYPAIISVSKLLFSDYWSWTLVGGQLILSIASVCSVAVLSCAIGLSRWFVAFSVFCVGTSISFTLDQMILADSICASILIIIICNLSYETLVGNRVRVLSFWVMGVGVSLAFLLREGVFILSILFSIPIFVRLFLSKCGLKISLSVVFAFFLPLIIMSQVYGLWNEKRTGDHFVTTGGQTVYLQGLMDAAKEDDRIFIGNEPIDVAAQENFTEFVFQEVVNIQYDLFNAGYLAPELADISKRRYFEAWANYPLSMLHMTLGHFRGRFASLIFRPLATLRDTGVWVNGAYPWPDYGDLRAGVSQSYSDLVLFLGESIERVIALALMLVFSITPIVGVIRLLLYKRGNMTQVLVCFALWLFYWGVVSAHLLVHIESRYFAPIIPFSVVIGCFGLQQVALSLRAWQSKMW